MMKLKMPLILTCRMGFKGLKSLLNILLLQLRDPLSAIITLSHRRFCTGLPIDKS